MPNGQGERCLRWASATNRTYAVWRADELGKRFESVARGLPSTPPVNEYTDASATPAVARFYRIEVE